MFIAYKKQNNTLSREAEGLGPMKLQQPHLE